VQTTLKRKRNKRRKKMFSSSKVSQAMIDAVNSVLGQTKPEPVQEVKTPEEGGRVPFAPATPTTLTEASVKIKTATGTKVYGSSYGNSAKAVKDQTRSSIDDIKEPTKKDIEKDAHLYKKTPPSTAKSYDQFGAHWAKEEVEVQEAAKPDFLDMDKDGNKKESMKKAISDKEVKEELKGNQHKIDANHNDKIDAQDFKILKAKKVREGMEFADKLLETVRKSDVPAYLRKAKGDTPLTVADVKGPKKDTISAPENLAKARNEGVEQYEPSNAPLTTDTLAGRMPGGKSNSFKSFKVRVKPLSKEGETKPGDDTPEVIQPQDTPARRSHEVREETIDEVTIAGTPGWKEMKKDVKDKSGAVHTPMSRAKDLARSAFKKLKKEVK
jgi:hypothetical protein